MFGLRKEVHRHPLGRRRAIGDDQDLGRAGDHIDTHRAEHAALGGRHISIAGTDDFVDLRHGLGTVGQRRHRLRAADGEHPVYPGNRRGCQYQLIFFAARRRHDHDEFTHARHLGGNRVHQHRRRISRLAARHVESDAVERGDLLAQHGAVVFGIGPGTLDLLLVVAPHTRCRRLQRRTGIGRQTSQRGIELGPAQFQTGQRSRRQAVEACGVFEHRRVAPGPDILQNVRHSLFDGGIGGVIELQQAGKTRLEIGLRAVETGEGNHGNVP